MTDPVIIDAARDDDWPAFAGLIKAAFNDEPDELADDIERLIFEPARGLIARIDGDIMGTAAILTRGLSVPGAVVAAGHVTLAAVAATARRRGILTRLMHRQFADMRAAGEPIAVLWATEGRIYQRFGYGMAVRRLAMMINNHEVRLSSGAPSGGQLREQPPTALRDTMIKIYDQLAVHRPGWSERAERHWDYRLADPPSWRRGTTALRAAVHDGEAGPDGYVLWRAKAQWSDAGPNGEARVLELVAANPAAYVQLWRFMLEMDLTRTTNVWAGAVDEPIQYLVNEPRQLSARVADALWLRLVDVPSALAARRYAAPVDLVLAVRDDVIASNHGLWRLTADGDEVSCVRTGDAPDLHCDVRALAASYLGGTPLSALAAAGMVEQAKPGALADATVAFGWPVGPSVLEVF